jgi:hypothetical protein
MEIPLMAIVAVALPTMEIPLMAIVAVALPTMEIPLMTTKTAAMGKVARRNKELVLGH